MVNEVIKDKKISQDMIINHIGEWQISFAPPVTKNEESEKVQQLSFEDILEGKENNSK